MLYIVEIRMHIYIYTVHLCNMEIFIENSTQRYSLTLPVPGCKDPQGTGQHSNGRASAHRCSWVTLATNWTNLCAFIDGILRYPSTAPTNRHNMNINRISLNLYYIKHYSMHYVNNFQTTFTLYIFIYNYIM